jgi:hypothetical protein
VLQRGPSHVATGHPELLLTTQNDFAATLAKPHLTGLCRSLAEWPTGYNPVNASGEQDKCRDGTPDTMTGKREDIQWLRALAVTFVVVYHLIPDTLPGGYVGVDIFFVISGFLIT